MARMISSGLVADDIGHLGVVQAVEHPVHDDGGDIQGHQPVQGAAQALEGQATQGDDHQVHAMSSVPMGSQAKLSFQQPGDEIGAAGGAPWRNTIPRDSPPSARRRRRRPAWGPWRKG